MRREKKEKSNEGVEGVSLIGFNEVSERILKSEEMRKRAPSEAVFEVTPDAFNRIEFRGIRR